MQSSKTAFFKNEINNQMESKSNFKNTTRGGRRSKKRANRRGRAAAGSSTDGMAVSLGSQSMAIFPARKQVKLFYNESVAITTGALGVAGVYVFSANGVYDPNISGTGHQPIGFDQMMLFYNHYTVLRSRIILTVRATTANYGGWASVAVKGTSTTVTAATQVVEDGFVVFAPLGIPTSSLCVRKFEMVHDVGKFQGMKVTIDNPDLSGDAASNPSEQTYFHVSYWNDLDNTNIVAGVNVLIEYDVVFREPRPLTQS